MAGGGEEAKRTDDSPGDGATRGTSRMEFFADAVFAISFTLPIVEIAVPEAGPGFGEALRDLWPSYLAYVLSSFVIGLYWVHHHFSGAIYRTTGHRFLLATVLFLTAIGYIDFPTRAFAEHISDPAARETGALFYSWSLAGLSLAWWIKWTVGRHSGDVDDRLDPAYLARLDRKYLVSLIAHIAGAIVSLASWPVGLAIAGCVMLAYLRAPETPVYRTRSPVIDGEG